jgi:uncharacterized protein
VKIKVGMTEAVDKHFVVDSMLGKLAKWLRILGFDACCERLDNQEQIEGYRRRGFILITRNRRWSGQPRVLWLTANDPIEQLRQVVALVPVTQKEIRLLRRCLRCNETLQETAPEGVPGQVPDYVLATHSSFYRCPNCRRIYWPGSHPERMIQRLELTLGWTLSEERPE